MRVKEVKGSGKTGNHLVKFALSEVRFFTSSSSSSLVAVPLVEVNLTVEERLSWIVLKFFNLYFKKT